MVFELSKGLIVKINTDSDCALLNDWLYRQQVGHAGNNHQGLGHLLLMKSSSTDTKDVANLPKAQDPRLNSIKSCL